MATLFAGTSGFAYASWKPDFYPENCPAKSFLSVYAARLNAVEINYTFRHLPSASTLGNWIQATSREFRFVIKAHQRITHLGRLKGVEQFAQDFLQSLAPLRDANRLGPVLFQLPPHLKCDIQRLTAFLHSLPGSSRYAFEFRHESWFSDSVYALLKSRGAALCIAESEGLTVPDVITADFAYYRFRKTEYSQHERRQISERLGTLLKEGRDVFAFFKHEETPAGALHAEELLRELH